MDHVHRQVRKAIDGGDPSAPDREPMFGYGDRLLVAVSGGKDSLALWDCLIEMGYRADGLAIGLGIGGYSARSSERSRRFAAERAEPRGLRLVEVDLEEAYGYGVPRGAEAARRPTCGVCGLSKRYTFNRVAVEHGYDVVVTGHNLDDEAATLLGNVLRWQDDFLRRQRPVLPATGPNQVRKVKPLYRLSEREMAAYCVLRGIDYVVEECPLVAGNTGLQHKDALNLLERSAPGTKAQFLFGFLERQTTASSPAALLDAQHLAGSPGEAADGVGSCTRCGMPTTGDTCAFCRQQDRILAALPQHQTPPQHSPRPRSRAGR